MKTALTRVNRKRSREFRLEGLEGRRLLSHVSVPRLHAEIAHAAVSAPITKITGRVNLTKAEAGPYFKVAPAFTSYGGHGHASPLGLVFVGVQQQVSTPVGSINPVSIINGSGV